MEKIYSSEEEFLRDYNPNDFDAIKTIIGDRNIILLEDNCESMGAEYNGKQAGTFGIMGTFFTVILCILLFSVNSIEPKVLYVHTNLEFYFLTVKKEVINSSLTTKTKGKRKNSFCPFFLQKRRFFRPWKAAF